MIADIRDGRAILLRRGPRGAPGARYAVKLRSGRWIKVLVGKRKVPISALPWRSTPLKQKARWKSRQMPGANGTPRPVLASAAPKYKTFTC
jgi:hypothetical protein